MKTATDKRWAYPESGDFGTFGDFVLGMLQLTSGTLPWRDNAHDVSCLPPAPGGAPVTYLLQLLWSEAHQRKVYHYVKMKLPDGTWGDLPDGRTVVEMHPANLFGDISKGLAKQAKGCSGLGRAVVVFKKGEPFHAMNACSPNDASHIVLTQDQPGLSSSVSAMQQFEAEAAGEDIELTVSWT